MQKFSLMVGTEEEVSSAITLIWRTLGVRGEVGVVPLEGKYKIDVISEADLTPLQISQLPGQSV